MHIAKARVAFAVLLYEHLGSRGFAFAPSMAANETQPRHIRSAGPELTACSDRACNGALCLQPHSLFVGSLLIIEPSWRCHAKCRALTVLWVAAGQKSACRSGRASRDAARIRIELTATVRHLERKYKAAAGVPTQR